MAAGSIPWSRTEEERKARRQAALARYAQKKDVLKAAQKRFRERNPQRVKEIKAKWRKRNKLSLRLKTQRRRALVKSRVGQVSKNIAQRLLVLQRGRCAACSADIRKRFQLDHIVALAAGGVHDDSNLQLLCPRCNQSKGARDPIEWAQLNGRLL